MDQLDETLRALRSEYEPDEGASTRVRALVAANLAGTIALSGDLSADPTLLHQGALTGGTHSGWLSAGALKVGAVALTLGGAAALWAGTSRWDRGMVEPAAHVPAVTSAASVRAVPVAEANAPKAPEPAIEANPIESRRDELAPVRGRPATLRAPSVGVAPAPQAEPQPKSGVSLEELRLLSEASQALRAGRLADAERALAVHRTRYPSSSLAGERQGLSLLIRCGDAVSRATRAEAERFVGRSSGTPIADSVRKKCLR